MKNINILHKITARIGDFHDSHLPLLKFVEWFMAPTQDKTISCKVTYEIMGFLDKFVTESLTSGQWHVLLQVT